MRFSSLVVLGCLAAWPAAAGEAPKSVVELFTSQGCSSCPPADLLATQIASEGKALVLTLPVDYWDYLGWKDTLASPAHSARQRGYAMARGDRKVFTPQIVVNGRESTVGGHQDAVRDAISRFGAAGLALPVKLEVRDGRVEVEVAKARRATGEAHAEVWAFAITRSLQVEIGRGENTGRQVAYANVVRHMTRLGVWEGAPARFEIAADEILTPQSDAIAILVQAGNGGKPGAILGAAQTESALTILPATTTSRLYREPF